MASRRALLAGLGTASASLAGCNRVFGGLLSREVPADWTPGPGEWCGAGYDQGYSGHNPHASPPRREPTVDWEVGVAPRSVAVADGTVFLRKPGTLHGLDVADGTEQFDVSRPPGWQCRYVDGRLYDLTVEYDQRPASDRQPTALHALTLDGVPEWDEPFRYDDRVGSFVERDDYIYVSDGTETIHCHDAETGERVDATVHEVAVRGLANYDGALYAALDDGVAAYGVADDGSLKERWRRRVDAADDVVATGLAVGGGWALLRRQRRDAMAETSLTVLDVEAGEVLGTVDFGRPIADLVTGPDAYVVTRAPPGDAARGGRIHALDGAGERWSVDLMARLLWLAVADGTLYVGSDIDNVGLVALDAGTGDELWSYDGAFPHAVVGETVYVTTMDDRFVALRA